MTVLLLVAYNHGFLATMSVMGTVYYLAAYHVLRYTNSVKPDTKLKAIMNSVLMVGLGEFLVKYLVSGQDNPAFPEFQRNTLSNTEGTLAALAVIAGWTAAMAQDKPKIHLTAWTTAAALSTTFATLTEPGQANQVVISFSMFTALFHLTATTLDPVKSCALHSYSTTHIGILRGIDLAWATFCVISLI